MTSAEVLVLLAATLLIVAVFVAALAAFDGLGGFATECRLQCSLRYRSSEQNQPALRS